MHIYTESPELNLCPHCKKPKRPHRVCLNCGYYKGEQVIDVLSELTKKERKKKEKEIEERKKEKSEEKGLTWEEMSRK